MLLAHHPVNCSDLACTYAMAGTYHRQCEIKFEDAVKLLSNCCQFALQMTLYSHEAYSIKLRCAGISGECSKHILDERGAPCSDDYYEVDVHANDRLSASILVPVGKPVGAAAIRKAFTESLANSAIAMFVPAPIRLKESYRWVLIVEPASAERAVIFYAVV